MKNTLSDLNNYLFESIERVMDDGLTEDQLDKELKRCDAVNKVAGTIVQNAKIALDTMKHFAEYGIEAPVPKMLQSEESKCDTQKKLTIS